MTVVALRGASLRLGGREVLHEVTLSIGAGRFVGVFGGNGAGKTTLLRALLGLVPPSAGAVSVFGARAAPGQAGIGYLPQLTRTPPPAWVRGRDLIASAVGGTRPGLPLSGAAARRDVDRALELVGATDLARRPLGSLSGGERQRVLLAQALLGAPRLLLLDEPLAGLDPRHQAGVVELVADLRRTLGVTVLFTAHDLNPLLPVIDDVLYLGGGHAALGAPGDVVTGPVLSRLYGAEIEVVHAAGRVFVLANGHAAQGGGDRCA